MVYSSTHPSLQTIRCEVGGQPDKNEEGQEGTGEGVSHLSMNLPDAVNWGFHI